MKYCRLYSPIFIFFVITIFFTNEVKGQLSPDSLQIYLTKGEIQNIILLLKKPSLKAKTNEIDEKFWKGLLFHYTYHFDSSSFYYNQYLKSGSDNKLLIKYAETGLAENKITLQNSSFNKFSDILKIQTKYNSINSLAYSQTIDSSFFALNNSLDSIFQIKTVSLRKLRSFKVVSPKTSKVISIANISDDGKMIFFNLKSKAKKSIGFGAITKTKYITVLPLPSISSSKNQQGFALSDDKKTLVFSETNSSNTFDLYSLQLSENGLWTVPSLLPKEINSDSDESFPILSSDSKQLYFSSNKPGGMGGYDIYSTEFDSSSQIWKKPALLPFPINSPWDDYCPSFDNSGNVIHLISNRNSNTQAVYSIQKTHKILLKVKVFTSDSSADVSDLNLRLAEHTVIKLSDFVNLKSESNVYFDSVFIGRHYDVSILDHKDTISMTNIDCLYDSDTSHAIYIDASILKHAQLLAHNQVLPFYARFGLHFIDSKFETNAVFKRLMNLMKNHKFYHLKLVLTKSNNANDNRIKNLKMALAKNEIDPNRYEIQFSKTSHDSNNYIESHIFIK